MSFKYNSEIPYGYCQCGCGEKTRLSNWTDKRIGIVKGQPRRYVNGHSRKYSAEKRVIEFWAKVNKNGSIPTHMPHLGQCWEWTASCIAFGYGHFLWDKKLHLSHRISWIIVNGTIPDDLFVLHKCDNPACVNPDHLFLGTKQDNSIDMFSKNRVSRKGENNSRHKLTDIQVAEIRRRYAAGGIIQQELANEYGVNQMQISAIVNYKSRK